MGIILAEGKETKPFLIGESLEYTPKEDGMLLLENQHAAGEQKQRQDPRDDQRQRGTGQVTPADFAPVRIGVAGLGRSGMFHVERLGFARRFPDRGAGTTIVPRRGTAACAAATVH